MLIVMAGLPGSGKSTIAAALARQLTCAIVSVDPIEAAMWQAGIDRSQPTGLAAYVVAEAIARAQLELEPARQQWRDLAAGVSIGVLFVEVVASNQQEHRRRLEARERDMTGFPEPTWESIEARRGGFAEWRDDRLRVDFLTDAAANAELIVAAVESVR